MNLERTSKRLAYLLRHSREPLYIDLDGGWAFVDTILDALHIQRSDLDMIVAADRKGRYSYDSTEARIRANQGHSIPGVELDMEQPEPPAVLYHGTATRFLPAILREGLKPMTRQWVHLSAEYETAVAVGRRHGQPVVLAIRAGDMAADGYALYRSTNGVWQAACVPTQYITVMESAE